MIYFLIYLFLEVLLSTQISASIGGLNTFFEILASAFFGMVILANFKSTLVENLQSAASGKIDIGQFQKLNIFTLLGAILLIVPGFLTDILGIIMQFSVFTSMFVNRFSAQSHNQSTYNSSNINFEKPNNQKTKEDEDVIDVEIITDTISK